MGNDETVWVKPKPLCATDGDGLLFRQRGFKPQVGYPGMQRAMCANPIGGPGAFCSIFPVTGAVRTKPPRQREPGNSHNATFLYPRPGPCRAQGQVEVEVVYRNDSFVRYTAAQELYSKPGLAKLCRPNCRRGRTREAPPPDEPGVSSIRPTPSYPRSPGSTRRRCWV